MSYALRTQIGSRRPETDADQVSEWETIAEEHMALYTSVL
jgi:hypothetical protein